MAPICVLWVLPSLEGGGAERAIVTLLKHMDRQKFDFHLCLYHRTGPFLAEVEQLGIPIHTLNYNGRLHPKLIWKLRQIIQSLKPAVTIGVLRSCGINTVLAHTLAGREGRVYINEQNSPSFEMKHYGNYLQKRAGYKFFLRYCDGIIATSEGIQKDLMVNFDQSGRKIKLIPNPVDLTLVQEKKKGVQPHPWLAEAHPTLVTVGRLHPQKGHDILLTAVARVKKRYPNLKLIIVGQGEEEKALKQLAASLGIDQQVDFVGFQSNPYNYIAHADLFVLASRYEGFGIVLAEALALGVPVVASDCPSGPADILASGEAGYLFPPENISSLADGIMKVLEDGTLRQKYQKNGLRHVQQFAPSKIAAQYETLITSVGSSSTV